LIIGKEALVREIARDAKLSQPVVSRVLDGYTKAVTQALSEGHQIRLIGFGSFYTRERDASTVRDFKTGGTRKVPARRVAAFRVGDLLKRAVAKVTGKRRKKFLGL
jgi:DNA-binding protein HU-beta